MSPLLGGELAALPPRHVHTLVRSGRWGVHFRGGEVKGLGICGSRDVAQESCHEDQAPGPCRPSDARSRQFWLRHQALRTPKHPSLETRRRHGPTCFDQPGTDRCGVRPCRIESQGHATRIDVHREVEDPGDVLQNPIHLDRTPGVSVQALDLVLDMDPAIRPRLGACRGHDEREQSHQDDARGDADSGFDPPCRRTALRSECGFDLGSRLHGRPYEAGGALGRADPCNSASAVARRSSATRALTASRPASNVVSSSSE